MLARASWLHRPPPSFCGSAWPLSIEATHRHHSPHGTWGGNTTLHSSCRDNTCVGILAYDHVRKHESSINKRILHSLWQASAFSSDLQLVLKEPFILFNKLLHSRQTYSLFSKVPFILFNKLLHSRQFTACSRKNHSFSLTSICILVRPKLVHKRTLHSPWQG